MKIQLTILVSLFISTLSFSQAKTDCEKIYTDFELYYKVDFDHKAIITPEGKEKTLETINSTIKLCPSYNKNIYVLGEEMLTRIITPINFGEDKNIWTNHLIDLYSKQSQYFPETKGENDIKKVLVAYNNRSIDDKQALTEFDKLFEQNKNSLNTETLITYTNLLVAQKNDFSVGYIKKTDALNSLILSKINDLEEENKKSTDEKFQNENNKKINTLNLTSKNIASSLKGAKIDCSTWNKLYKEDFESNKSDVFWLENALSKLESSRCMNDNEVFNTIAKRYYELKKTSKSAYYMASIALKNKERDKAISFFNESADLETDKIQKAKLYQKIGELFRNSDKAQAKSYFEKAIENNPDTIESYVMLSQLYANAGNDCIKDEFEQKALYLLASQTIEKATKINSRFKDAAKRTSDDFLKKAPTKDEIKKAKMQGKTIHFGCWINQSITIQ